MMAIGTRIALGVLLLALLSGCAREHSVEITLITQPREGQLVQDHYIEMQMGQALGVRVVGMKNGQARKHYSVEARAENPAVLGVHLAAHEEKDEDGERFVLSAARAGATQIRFRLDDKHDVFVDTLVVERPDWEKAAPAANYGGAGGGSN